MKFELIKESIVELLPEIKPLEAQWKEIIEMQVEIIKKINKFDQENYSNFLIKPYHQYQNLQYLIGSTKRSQSKLSNMIFKGHVRLHISQPSQLKPMLDIFQLREEIKKKDQNY